MAEPMKFAVAGAGGRMGRMLMKAVLVHPGCELVAAFDRREAKAQGEDAGVLAGLKPAGITVRHDAATALDVADGLLDFTGPEATLSYAPETAKRGSVHIIGTTGLSDAQEEQLRKLTEGARVVRAGNFSLGVNLVCALTKAVAERLGPDYDVEISETHHRHKTDAPSGTALMLGRSAAEGRGIDLAQNMVSGRDGITGPRKEGTIGFSSIRAGEVIGEHTVLFAGLAERLEFKHVATDRALFAGGALAAGLWGRSREPGFYTMMDVLGL